MGVPDSVILVENKTRNTHESAAKVKNMLQDLGYTSHDCLLITSAFHMRRSLACYRKVGLTLDPFTTDFYRSEEHTSELKSLMRISYAVFCLTKKKKQIL